MKQLIGKFLENFCTPLTVQTHDVKHVTVWADCLMEGRSTLSCTWSGTFIVRVNAH